MDSLDKFNAQLRTMAGQMNGLIKSLPQQLGAVALESIDDNFRSQSFFGTPWKPRVVAKGNDGRALLVKSGRLRRSFKLQNSGLTVVLFTDVPYAEIHNEGGSIQETVTVASFVRKNGAKVREHTRRANTTIPQRQFMGEHPELDNRFFSLLERELTPIFED